MSRLPVLRAMALTLALALATFASSALAQGSTTVNVELTEFDIIMPGTIEAGPTAFVITNSGAIPHTVTIEGEGISVSLDADLASGETGTLEVDLAPGAYTVVCPIPGHPEAGMSTTLTVVAAEEPTPTPEPEPESTATTAPEPTATTPAGSTPSTDDSTPTVAATADTTPTALPGLPNTGAGGSQTAAGMSTLMLTAIVLLAGGAALGGGLLYRSQKQAR